MADEYGNLEVGIEIIDGSAQDLPKTTELQVVYLYRGSMFSPAGRQLTMEPTETPLMPAVYSLVGIRRVIKTQTAYDASDSEYKKNKKSDFNMDFADMRSVGKITRKAIPEALTGYVLTADTSSGSTYYAEATVIYLLAPSGISQAPAEPETENDSSGAEQL